MTEPTAPTAGPQHDTISARDAAGELTAWCEQMRLAHPDHVLPGPDGTVLRADAVDAVLIDRERLYDELLRARVAHALAASGATIEEIAEESPSPQRLIDAVRGPGRFTSLHLSAVADGTGTSVRNLLRGIDPLPPDPEITACTVDTSCGEEATIVPAAYFDNLLEDTPAEPNLATREAFQRLVGLVQQVEPEGPRHQPSGPPTVADLLRRTLDAHGATQVDLCRWTGLSTKHVSQILKGLIDLSPQCAVKIGRALGVPAQVWLGLQGARHQWEADQLDPGPHEPVVPKIRKQRDEARATAAGLQHAIERLAARNSTDSLQRAIERLAARTSTDSDPKKDPHAA